MLDWERRTQYIIAVVLGALIFGAGMYYMQMRGESIATPGVVPDTGIKGSENIQPVAVHEEEAGIIYVHVAGAVMRPGLYEMPAESRVNDAVQKAVPSPDANIDALNLAARLSDGQKILVPSQQTTSAATETGDSGDSKDYIKKININTASAAELETLPGIGPALAKKIVNYREKQIFQTVEDIKNVPGIGESRYNQLKDLITVY